MTEVNEIQGFDKWRAVQDVLRRFTGCLIFNDCMDQGKWMLRTKEEGPFEKFTETEIRCAIIYAFNIVKYDQTLEEDVNHDECMEQMLTKVDVDNIIENLRAQSWFESNGKAKKIDEFILNMM